MSTKPKAARFFLRRVERPTPAPEPVSNDMIFGNQDDGFGNQDFRRPAPEETAGPILEPAADPIADPAADEAALAAIAAEGLTGRQLRRARLMAQKHMIAFASDLDAVLQLRRAGIDPFSQTGQDGAMDGPSEPSHLVAVPNAPPADPARALARLPGDRAQLPAKARPINPPTTEVRAETSMVSEILRMQQDIISRRRKRLALLFGRMFVFVLLPTLFAGWYFYRVATPVFATHSEFVIQSSDQAAGAGMGGLLAGTGLATSQDSITVQGYLQSREAMLRLEKDLGFSAHFQNPEIDPLQRLEAGASQESSYRVYKRFVKISHDPTEGLIRMEVMAVDPETAAAWANQLIKYAEEQVDQLTQRMRVNQMSDAQVGYDDAQNKLEEAQRKLIELQETYQVLSSESEVGLITGQIAELETQMTQEKLSLAQMESNENPNAARMEPVRRRIATLEDEISALRSRLSVGDPGSVSLAEVQGELLIAEVAVETRQMILAQSLQSMELARIEAGRQVRYLSVSVSPTPPDEPAYPKAFENTLVTLLILIGIYLMVSMTAAILREQVSS